MSSKFLRSLAACAGAGITALGISDSGLLRKMVFAQEQSNEGRHKVLIIGGGTAGTTVANQISRKVVSIGNVVIHSFKLSRIHFVATGTDHRRQNNNCRAISKSLLPADVDHGWRRNVPKGGL